MDLAIPFVDQRQARRHGSIGAIGGQQALYANFSQQPGSAQIFYNVDCLSDPQLSGFPLIITEGEMDALAAIQCGYPKTISVPGGAPEHDSGDDGARWNYLGRTPSNCSTARS